LNQELAPVLSVREVMTGVHLLQVESSGIASSSQPGQFVMIGCDSGYGRLLRRPISVHRVEGNTLSFLFAVVGTGTEWLAQRQPGEKIDLLGPVGNGFSIYPKSRNLLMVAGGMGIAPFCFLAQEALKKNCTVKLVAGAKTACQICPREYLPTGIEVIAATEDGTAGEKGLVTAILPKYSEWADQVFACGPVPMYRAMAGQYDAVFKDKPFQVSLEVRMGCGMGFCYACTINTRQGLKQACKDGPVFNMEDVVWEELR
jgi:dihydroorotate dehydrogenase electron transfer subunit